MDITRMNIFIEVVNQGSITKAAQKLYISEQAISKALAILEKEFGKKILVSSPRGSKPTEFGDRLYIFSEGFIKKNEILMQDIEQLKKRRITGQINVGCVYSGISNVIPEIMIYALKNYPNITLNIEEAVSNDIVRKVKDKIVDIGFIMKTQCCDGKSTVLTDETITYSKLTDMKTFLWSKKDINLNEIKNWTDLMFIVHSKFDIETLKVVLSYLGLTLNESNTILSDNIYLIQKMVDKEMAVCFDIGFRDRGIVFDNIFQSLDVKCLVIPSNIFKTEFAIIKKKTPSTYDNILELFCKKIEDYFEYW